MRLLSLRALLRPVGLAAALSCVGCSGSDASPASGGSSGAKASGGAAGKATGGNGSGGNGDSKAGAGKGGAESGGGDPSDAGASGGDDSQPGGAGGTVPRGGAPSVDYGDPEVPPAQWTNITGMFAGMQSECGNMSGIFSSPFVDMLVLGVARQGLWSSTDGGDSFAKLGTSGDKILNRLTTVVWDPSSSDAFYVSGIYGWEDPFTDGAFKTTNLGASFVGYKKLSAIQSHNDSISIDFNDPARKTLLAGGHEQADVLFLSADAGESWTNIRASLPENLGFCTQGLVLDAERLLVACAASYSRKSGAIVRSSDGGATWTKVSDQGAVNQPLWAYDGSIYWTAEAGGLLKSDDQGVSFKSVASNTSNRVAPIQLPDGRVVSIVNRVLSASADGGKTWQAIGTALPFDAVGLDYSPFRRAFYATQFDCNGTVPQDAIERYGYDFKQ